MGLFSKKGQPDRALRKILKGHEAPSFPQMMLRILEKVRDHESGLDEITDMIQWDARLVVRILSTVNTAAYGPANPIQNIGHAVSYLGRSQIEQIVLALAVRDALPSQPAAGFDPRRYWATAGRRATLGKILADKLHPADAAACFTAGLLQDVAIPVLATVRAEEYGPVLEQWHADRDAHLETLEQAAFGWTHADVGGLLGRNWDLPEVLSIAIQDHHRTDTETLLPALHLVSILRESQADHGVEALVEEARAQHGLEADWVAEAVQRADAQSAELVELLGGSSARTG